VSATLYLRQVIIYPKQSPFALLSKNSITGYYFLAIAKVFGLLNVVFVNIERAAQQALMDKLRSLHHEHR
jgi:hypothetical protein